MFGKSYRTPKPEEPSETTILNQSSSDPDEPNLMAENKPDVQPSFVSQNKQKIEASDSDNPEVVNNVEKISRIVAPYFIALIGLSLYGENFLIGTILIGTGIVSLFKVSTKDVATFLTWVKGFLGFGENQP